MQPVTPIQTVELFPPLSAELLSLLSSLQPDDWQRPTPCPQWTVQDVAAHLLGGNLGRLPDPQPGPAQPAAPISFDDLLQRIDQNNAEWVAAARRISPSLLIEFLRLTDPLLYQRFKSLPPDSPARAAVVWAGEQQSAAWFDIAREYTEKWLHQQHIRLALGRPLLTERQWLFPVLDTFMRALPYTYRHFAAAEGAALAFEISGEAGGEWSLLRRQGEWHLYTGRAERALVRVQLAQDLAWQLFTKGIRPEAARPQLQIHGDQTAGLIILQMVAIMA